MNMTPTSSTFAVFLAAVSLHIGNGSTLAQQSTQSIRLDFENGVVERWVDIKLADRATRFTVASEGENSFLRADSDESAAALWYGLNVDPRIDHVVTWRWKVAGTLDGNTREREKKGDDYAARFFVIFDDQPFSRKARAICYVWAAAEPVGAAYPNPYHSNVTTIVLQSGEMRAGEWVVEARDFVGDYLRAFGREPRVITAIAVMVDTDNTKRKATAWFDEISITSGTAGSPK
jgi:hypothetical protein